MHVELTKKDIGLIVVALHRYIKRHELFTDTEKLNMQTISLFLHDLHDASELAIRLDEFFRGDLDRHEQKDDKTSVD